MQKLSLVRKFLKFSSERFPIPAVMAYSGTLFFAAYLFPNLMGKEDEGGVYEPVAGFLTIFFLFLILRILDEHKDFEKDRTTYPDRLLSRGVVTLFDLRRVLIAVFTLSAFINLTLGIFQFLWWSVVVIWSLLMFREFFIEKWLQKHPGLHLISHQFIVSMMVLYAINFKYSLFKMSRGELLKTALFILGITSLTITYEIARKIKPEERTFENVDSYSKIWGVKGAVAINHMAAIFGLLSHLFFIYKLSFNFILSAVGFYLIFFITSVMFLVKPEKKTSKLMEVAGAVYMLALFTNSIIAFL